MVVIMALSATRPVVMLAERMLERVARSGGGTPAAWWITILTVGPLLGSLITEPAAMTICALLLARQFFDLEPSSRLRLATIGLLFVNVSIGGTLTHFAAPPVLMVARSGNGTRRSCCRTSAGAPSWRSAFQRGVSARVQARAAAPRLSARGRPDVPRRDGVRDRLLPVPAWITLSPALYGLDGLNGPSRRVFRRRLPDLSGLRQGHGAVPERMELRGPLLVGFFLAGLVIHGGLQAWWIGPSSATSRCRCSRRDRPDRLQ